jgi:hypothetical protein
MSLLHLASVLSLTASGSHLGATHFAPAGGFSYTTPPVVRVAQQSFCFIEGISRGSLLPGVSGLTLSTLEAGGQPVRFSVNVGEKGGIGPVAILRFTRPTRSLGPAVVGESVQNRIQLTGNTTGTFNTTGTPTQILLNRRGMTQLTYDLTVTSTALLEPGSYVYGSTVTCFR